jgi:hypothetical protein
MTVMLAKNRGGLELALACPGSLVLDCGLGSSHRRRLLIRHLCAGLRRAPDRARVPAAKRAMKQQHPDSAVPAPTS